MKTMMTYLIMGILAAGVALAEEKVGQEPKTKPQTTCPVMGDEVNKKLYVDYAGKRVYVCCKGCLKEVKANPEKYIAKLEKEGVTLDKAPVTDPAK